MVDSICSATLSTGAISVPTVDRQASWVAACGDDEALRPRINWRLAAHDDVCSLFESALGPPHRMPRSLRATQLQ